MLINITNHPSALWSKAQTQAALEQFGPIEDLPFPLVRAEMSDEEIGKLTRSYLSQILDCDHPTVLLQGEFIFTYRLIVLLKEHRIPVVACQSNIEREEYQDENGNTVKQTVYRFGRFRAY